MGGLASDDYCAVELSGPLILGYYSTLAVHSKTQNSPSLSLNFCLLSRTLLAILRGLSDPRRKSQFEHNPLFPVFTDRHLELHPIIWRLISSLRFFEILKSDNDVLDCTTILFSFLFPRRRLCILLRRFSAPCSPCTFRTHPIPTP